MATKEPSVKIGLNHNGKDVASSLLTIIEHLMIFPPRYTTHAYNLGVEILFDSIRQSLDIEEDHDAWETGVM